MYKYEDQKEMRMALNGKMVVMLAGIFLIMTALTNTLIQGMQYFYIGSAAKQGIEEAVKLLEESSLTIGKIYSVGFSYVAVVAAEVIVGVICVKNSNRLDKVKICLYADVALFGVKILQQIFMTVISKVFNPLAVIAGLLMPLVVLWGITRLMKLAKKYPDRTYAVEPNNARMKQQEQPQNKNLMAKAKAKVKDEARVSQIIDEIQNPSERRK